MTDNAPARRHAAGQNPARKQRILDGADTVFLERGFDAAGVNDICRAAGVSKSTLYVYFDNKEELFAALVEQKRDAIFAEVRKELTTEGSLEQQLTGYLSRMSEILCADEVVRAQRTIIGIAERMPELGARFYEGGANRGKKTLCDYLTAKAADGQLSIDDPDHASYQLMELATAGLLRQRLFGLRRHPPSDREISTTVKSALRVFLAAYGPATAI
jgi:AcrR family transcriptional regulator